MPPSKNPPIAKALTAEEAKKWLKPGSKVVWEMIPNYWKILNLTGKEYTPGLEELPYKTLIELIKRGDRVVLLER